MEADAFERALRPLLPRSAAYAASFLRERGDAEDAVQQAALRAWQRRAHYDARRLFKPWWFAILRNQCLDQWRARKRVSDFRDLDDSSAPTPADESAFNRRALASAMDRLPEMHREVLRLKYFGELTYQELADALDIPLGTVMSRLHLARKALAALITTEDK